MVDWDRILAYQPTLEAYVRRLPRSAALSHEDLVSAGVLALAEADDRYDPSKGKWKTWANLRARGAMWDVIRKSTQRRPTYRYQFTEKALGRWDEPTEQDVCQEACDRDERRRLQRGVSRLELRDQKVLIHYYVFGRTDRAIAELVGLSETRIRQLRRQALQRLSNTNAAGG